MTLGMPLHFWVESWVYRQLGILIYGWSISQKPSERPKCQLIRNLDEQLVGVKVDPKSDMKSYLVYLLVARTKDYLGLYKRGSMQDAYAQPYVVYPQLVKKKILEQSIDYRVVNEKLYLLKLYLKQSCVLLNQLLI